tara:strand:+ start:145 stop:1008 length:864 start_codon:yes stop_codon:yes gene_type:complete
MPLDIINENNNIICDVPFNLDFNVGFEPTLVKDKKYVINQLTGEYIGVVGNSFNCANHSDFFYGVQNTMSENLSADELQGAKTTWKTSRNNAWALMDVTLPNVTAEIVTSKHQTTVSQRVIALHGIDGSCSNMVFFGAIDFFCTNGMIRGEHDKVRRKNTANFSMDRFIADLSRSKQDFYAQSERLQHWATIDLSHINVKDLLDGILKSDRKSEKMFTLYNQEVGTRGRNVFALYSAFTNYASYADERNGFNLRNTGNDTQAMSMFNREHEVSKWIESKQFKELVAA